MAQEIVVDHDILFFAFRYALGRSSYAPVTVIDNIKVNIKSIDTFVLKDYIREIHECKNLGMGIDRDNWMDFVEYIEAELEKRK